MPVLHGAPNVMLSCRSRFFVGGSLSRHVLWSGLVCVYFFALPCRASEADDNSSTCSNGLAGIEDAINLNCCDAACGVCGGAGCGNVTGLTALVRIMRSTPRVLWREKSAVRVQGVEFVFLQGGRFYRVSIFSKNRQRHSYVQPANNYKFQGGLLYTH